MKALAICQEGLEFATQQEIKEQINEESVAEQGAVKFEATPQKIAQICYHTRAAKRILALLDEFKIEKLSDLKRVEKVPFNEWFDKETTFAIRGIRSDSEEFSRSELEEEAGKHIQQPVNLSNPDIIIIVLLRGKKVYVGIDLTGKELDKRDYRIFPHQTTVKATIAHAMLRLAEYKKEDTLLDLNCKDGTIVIEAAQYATGMAPRYYDKEKMLLPSLKPFKKVELKKLFDEEDKKIGGEPQIFSYDEKMNNVVAAQKNSKIAGVNKKIIFSRTDIDWMDTKFDKAQIDKIVTNTIMPTRTTPLKDIQKKLNEIMHQAEYVLKPKGAMVTITRNPEQTKEAAEKNRLKIVQELKIKTGDETLTILKIQKTQADAMPRAKIHTKAGNI